MDEYDKPLVSNLNVKENFDHDRVLLATLYSNFKSSAEHIRLVFLTGVSRFSRLSIFSDLNNLNDISFDNEFADICGITEKELLRDLRPGIEALADKKKISFEEACHLLKRTYDGYRFAEDGSDIYNPWSLLSCMQKQRVGQFWNQTGLPTVIAEVLRKANMDLERVFNSRCPLDTLAGMDLTNPDPTALMYQTGYLTIKNYDSSTDIVTLGIPNEEVSKGLFNMLLPYYVKIKNGSADSVVMDIIESIKCGKPETLIDLLDTFLAGVPYELKIDSENNLQNALFILLRLIGMEVRVEVHTTSGRMDILIETPDFIYIVELKYDRTSEEGARQIENKEYALPFRFDGRKVFKIGVNFSASTRHLDTPVITRMTTARK